VQVINPFAVVSDRSRLATVETETLLEALRDSFIIAFLHCCRKFGITCNKSPRAARVYTVTRHGGRQRMLRRPRHRKKLLLESHRGEVKPLKVDATSLLQIATAASRRLGRLAYAISLFGDLGANGTPASCRLQRP
jgi:hypothetical protein